MKALIGVTVGVVIGHLLKDYKIGKNKDHIERRTSLHPKM